MDDSTKEVFQYYTIIKTKNVTTEAEDNNNQVIYLAIDREDQVANIATEELKDVKDGVEEHNTISELGSSAKIITLEDGRMFITTSEDETFESIEPHLITTDNNDQDHTNTEMELSQNSNDTNYEIVEVVGDSPQMYEMVYCDVSSSEEINTKKKSYICLYKGCGKMYSLPHHLNVHMRNHLDSKPYVCTEEGCDKTFSTNYSLKAHIRTHTGEKPYSCVVCQKCFKTSGDLHKHLRTHTGEKPFRCPIEGCLKSFTTSNIRKVHIRSHTGERPYTCDYPNCGKAFSSSTNYKNHVRIHSGEKPYVCNVKDCGKRFTEYSSLYKHNLVHQPDRPYICIFCGQKFKQDSTMNLHKRLKHNVIVASDGTEIVVDLN